MYIYIYIYIYIKIIKPQTNTATKHAYIYIYIHLNHYYTNTHFLRQVIYNNTNRRNKQKTFFEKLPNYVVHTETWKLKSTYQHKIC